MRKTKGMPAAEKWKWAKRELLQQIRNRKNINIKKLMASARTTHSIRHVRTLFETHEYAEARSVVDNNVKDILTGKVADNHLIMDMAKVCVEFGLSTAKKGRIRYGRALIDKAQDIYEWFADRLERMIKTLSSAFNFQKKSETPTYVISLDALIKNAYGFIETSFGRFENACTMFRQALQLEYKIFDRQMKDFMGLSPDKRFQSEIGKGTRLSMTLAHLHLAACLTSLRKYQQARQEAKQAVKYMVESVKDPDAHQRNAEIKYLYAVALYNFGIGEMNLKRYSKGVGEMYRAYIVAAEALGEGDERTRKLKTLYSSARKNPYPGLSRYPILKKPLVDNIHHEGLQVDKTCFPSGLFYKAFATCIESTYLLPYSYRLTHGTVVAGKAKLQDLIDTSVDNVIAGNIRRQKKVAKAIKLKRPPNATETILVSRKGRPSTVGVARRRRRPSYHSRRPHTASANGRQHSSGNVFHSPRVPTSKKRRSRNRTRPSTANIINMRAKRVYVKLDKRAHASQHTIHSSGLANFSPRRPHTSNGIRRRQNFKSRKFRKFSKVPSSVKKHLMKSQPGPEVAHTFHTPYK